MPSSDSSATGLADLVTSGFAARAIRQKARQLAGRSGFSISEQDDIEQELRLHLFRRLPKFNPQVAHWNVFVRTLVERHTATLATQRLKAKRALQRVEPRAEAQECNVDLAIDTEMILATLPERTRNLCERLKKDSVAQVADQLGMPRSTLRDALGRLQKHFQSVGRQFFRKSSATSHATPVDQ